MTSFAISSAQPDKRLFSSRRLAWSERIPWGMVSGSCVLALWCAMTSGGMVSTLVLPGPDMVFRSFWKAASEGYAGATLLDHVGASALRLAVAFVATAGIGVPLGLVMGSNRIVREVVSPWLELYRPVPSLAYMGLLIIWLGVGDLSRVTLLILGGLPAIIIGTTQAVGRVRADRIQGARALGMKGFALFRNIVFPSCLPDILVSIRIAATGIFTTLVAAELMGSRVGLGAMLSAASNQMEPGMVYLVVLLLGAMGLSVDQALRWSQRHLVPWAGKF
jgi:taurine transport system permease protein